MLNTTHAIAAAPVETAAEAAPPEDSSVSEENSLLKKT